MAPGLSEEDLKRIEKFVRTAPRDRGPETLLPEPDEESHDADTEN